MVKRNENQANERSMRNATNATNAANTANTEFASENNIANDTTAKATEAKRNKKR